MIVDEFSEVAMTREAAHAACNRAYQHAQAMLANNESVRISCGPAVEPVGIQQRRFLHGVVLKQISEQAKVDGVRFSIDIWKEHYRKRFVGAGGFRWEAVRGIVIGEDGQAHAAKHATPRRVRMSTEELGTKAYAKFIEQVIDHATVELAVVFDIDEADQPQRRAR